ncbi:MAG: hypothetical protein K2Y05_01095, partial [Hyphomicrobiaceae bacterium]|nr:hypothetical protein [Hyphomicrobiaceae bacterium]
LVGAGSGDIVYTPKVSGIPANFLKPSLARAGVDLATVSGEGHKLDLGNEAKAWSTVWSAGHGVAAIRDVPTVAALADTLRAEFHNSNRRLMNWDRTTDRQNTG